MELKNDKMAFFEKYIFNWKKSPKTKKSEKMKKNFEKKISYNFFLLCDK